MLNIVLFEPEIAVNTANISRTCYLTNTRLHLIRPLGFRISDKIMRRVGLDYWEHVDLVVHNSFEDFIKYKEENDKQSKIYLSTTHANRYYTDIKYEDGDYIMFGSESKGVYEYMYESLKQNSIKIPMRKDSDRSLNLCNSANIVLYEAYRQIGFENMK